MVDKKFSLILLVLVLFLFTISTVTATTYCLDDTDCIDEGENYVCDTSTYICEEDVSSSTSSSSDETTCSEDSECEDLGDFWVCDTDELICVELDDLDLGETVNNETEEISSTELSALQTEIDELQTLVSTLEESDITITSQVEEILVDIDLINTNLELISTGHFLDDEDLTTTVGTIQNELDSAIAGLAVVQEDLGLAQADISEVESTLEASAARAELIKFIALIVIVITIFIALIYFLFSHHKHSKQKPIPPKVKEYITKHIKSGAKYEAIEKKLLKAGWPKKEIKRAYDITVQHNYFEFQKAQGKIPKNQEFRPLVPANNNRIIVISILTIVIMSSLMLFVSNSTGQAIYSDETFIAVESALTSYAQGGSSHPFLEGRSACVKIEDDSTGISVSYAVSREAGTVSLASLDCELDSSYDYAIKLSYTLANEFFSDICSVINVADLVEKGEVFSSDFVVLKSQTVEESFSLADVEYNEFCSTLLFCLGSTNVANLGLTC